jgi:lipopolysaccharide/colanic/teichoic acid biosynthesis glycosyltransferase
MRGEMSLVGPRPCTSYEFDQYLPWQRERFNVVPGLTGLWQVSGKNQTTFNEMIRLDIAYGNMQSPWLDLKIIFKTLPALFEQVTNCRLFNHRRAVAAHTSVGAAKPAVEGLREAGNLAGR